MITVIEIIIDVANFGDGRSEAGARGTAAVNHLLLI